MTRTFCEQREDSFVDTTRYDSPDFETRETKAGKCGVERSISLLLILQEVVNPYKSKDTRRRNPAAEFVAEATQGLTASRISAESMGIAMAPS